MTARQQRRQSERKARKAANKAQAQQPYTAAAPTANLSGESFDWTPEPSVPTRAAINRANAQQSTGPRTSEGKAASSQNNFRHGLTGNFAVLGWEDLDRFVELSFQLHEEHQPATMTEFLLVERMAQHQWLSQRALHLQNTCFHMDLPFCEQEKQLALYLRYGTTHDRAFHKCLSDLLKLRAQRSKEQAGFESQTRQAAAETRKQELHAAKLRGLTTQAPSAKPGTTPPIAPETPRSPVNPTTDAGILHAIGKTQAA
jgi:hypothetical protein